MTKKKNIIFIAIALTSIFVIAMGLSLAASSFPDGLEKVAENLGFAERATNIIPESFFLIPDYALQSVGNEKLQTSLAGFLGVLIILALFILVYLVYRAATEKNSRGVKKPGK